MIENKSESRQMVIQYLLEHENATKQDLFVNLNLSLPTIKSVLEYLLEEKIICISGKVKNTGGRNAVTYSINSEGRIAIGIYLSPHHLTAAAVDMKGNILETVRESVLMDLQEDTYLRRIGRVADTIREKLSKRFDLKNLIGVGIAIPSMVSKDGETILFGMTHNYQGINRAVLSRYISEPTILYHDSYAAGFAEVWQNHRLQNSIYLNINNTVGSCVIIDGRIYEGNDCRAGEFGHVLVQPKGGRRCYCGRCGCLDTVCNTMILEDYAKGSVQDFFRVLDEGDSGAQKIWEEYVEYLAIAIHNSRMMFDAAIIIGGTLGANIGDHIDDIYKKVDEYKVFSTSSREYIVTCIYRVEATAVGAALGMIEREVVGR